MKRRWLWILGGAAALLAVLVLVGPFLVPVPSLPDQVPPRQAAPAQSEFVEVDGVEVRLARWGGSPTADETCTVVMLHGFGGTADTFDGLREELGSGIATGTASGDAAPPAPAEVPSVIAYDRTGFGFSERPRTWTGTNPYSLEGQADQVWALVDELGGDDVVFVAHSAGAAVALLAYDQQPERVRGMVFINPSVYDGSFIPEWLKPVLRSPQLMRLGPLVARQLGGDNGRQLLRDSYVETSAITPQAVEVTRRVDRAEGWDRSLWEFTVAPRSGDGSEVVARVDVPVVVIAGVDDPIVDFADHERIAAELPEATLVALPETGHIAHEERRAAVAREVAGLLEQVGCGP